MLVHLLQDAPSDPWRGRRLRVTEPSSIHLCGRAAVRAVRSTWARWIGSSLSGRNGESYAMRNVDVTSRDLGAALSLPTSLFRSRNL